MLGCCCAATSWQRCESNNHICSYHVVCVHTICRANSLQGLSGLELYRQLISLRKSDVEDHRGVIRPLDAVFERGVQLLVDTSRVLRQVDSRSVPHGCVSPDFEGGIRIEWVRPSASVHLVIGPGDSATQYIYHERGADYGVDDHVSAERLASWLRLIEN